METNEFEILGVWDLPTNNSMQEIHENLSEGFLGLGATGEVRKSLNYAVKQIYEQGMTVPGEDIQVAHGIKCPFAVKYYGGFKHSGFSYLVMDYVEKKTLKELMEKVLESEDTVPESAVSQIACQLLLLLTYLKKQQIIHGDLKPENIFLAEEGKIKVGGFCNSGLKNGLIHDGNFKFRGYMAPEIGLSVKKHDVCCASDLWSVGIITAELFLGKFPLNENYFDSVEYFAKIEEQLTRLFKNQSFSLIEDFVLKCCKFRPDYRSDPEKLLRHPFITKYNENILELEDTFERNCGEMEMSQRPHIPEFDEVKKLGM